MKIYDFRRPVNHGALKKLTLKIYDFRRASTFQGELLDDIVEIIEDGAGFADIDELCELLGERRSSIEATIEFGVEVGLLTCACGRVALS